MDFRVEEIISNIQSGEIRPEIMGRILDLHEEIADIESRSALISAFTEAAKIYESNAESGDDLGVLIKTRKQGVSLMCTQESLLSDGTIDHKTLSNVVRRELAAGNIDPDDEIFQLAEIGMQFFTPMKKRSSPRKGLFRRLFG